MPQDSFPLQLSPFFNFPPPLFAFFTPILLPLKIFNIYKMSQFSHPQNLPQDPCDHYSVILSGTTQLHGVPSTIKTEQQLRVDGITQASNDSVAQPRQDLSKLKKTDSSNKFRDAKPRLLLMGLRRYVCLSFLSRSLYKILIPRTLGVAKVLFQALSFTKCHLRKLFS